MITVAKYTPTDRSRYRTYVDVLHQDVASKGTHGQPVLSDYVQDGQVWALVQALTGSKFEEARKLIAKASFLVVTDYNAILTVNKTLRFVDQAGNTRLLHIGHVNNCDELNIEMRLLCTEDISDED